MDKSGFEPKTSPMLRGRATNYATCPSCYVSFISCNNHPTTQTPKSFRTALLSQIFTRQRRHRVLI
ncbi:hypothetical protein LQ764DRAFT_233133 [Zygosaccharomyces rouxii]|nr:hypothetical protein LQ764DRAFT_233133 [Zygosaccharomyces rouxii]